MTLPHSHEPLNDGDMNLTPEQENNLPRREFDAVQLLTTLERAQQLRDLEMITEWWDHQEAERRRIIAESGLGNENT